MPCEYAVVDVVDILGTRNDNVTKNINKWKVDSFGIRQTYEGRNIEQRDLDHDEHHDLDSLLLNGIHARSVDAADFDGMMKENKYNFVNFYAPWCIWCQRLEPVWEAFAEKIDRERLAVNVVKVDCVANAQLCTSQNIQAFPTLRLFKDGKVVPGDYRSDRTVDAIFNFIKDKVSLDTQIDNLPLHQKVAHEEKQIQMNEDHPGCMMVGYLVVNRVPGNFHIEARSKHHNLNPVLANVSHIVNSMSFGNLISKRALRQLESIPKEFFNINDTHPIDGNVYVNYDLHQAYHHYIKVVSTAVEIGRFKGPNEIIAYQMVQAAQLMQYAEGEVPEARFSYDISPMAVDIETKRKAWYEFITSMCALIGGTFTVVGLISSCLGIVFKQKKI